MHQMACSASATAETHPLCMSCVLVTAGSSCKRQQQQRSITNSNHLHQADGAAGAIAEFHLTLSCCVFASVGPCPTLAQLQAATAASQSDLHQADVAAGAVAESHLTPSSCLLVNVGHSCQQQQRQCSITNTQAPASG